MFEKAIYFNPINTAYYNHKGRNIIYLGNAHYKLKQYE